MKLRCLSSPVTRHSSPQSGMAVIIILILITIILIYVAGNIRMLHHLNHDLQLVEQKQLIRIGMTNAPPKVLIRTNLPSSPAENPTVK